MSIARCDCDKQKIKACVQHNYNCSYSESYENGEKTTSKKEKRGSAIFNQNNKREHKKNLPSKCSNCFRTH